MKMEFEGKLDAIIADMIGTLSMLGFRLQPKEDEVPVRRPVAPPPLPDDVDMDERITNNGKPDYYVVEPAGVVDFDALPKKRGRPKKEPPSPREEIVTAADVAHAMEDDDILNTPREDPDPTEELAEDPTYVQASMDTIALHRLKEEMLKKLRDMYVSGKGPFVRQLLAKHGHGALAFPEVEAQYFPAIKADVDRGMLQ